MNRRVSKRLARCFSVLDSFNTPSQSRRAYRRAKKAYTKVPHNKKKAALEELERVFGLNEQ